MLTDHDVQRTGVSMRPDLLVHLGFHGVGQPGRPLDPGEDEFWVSRELFEQVLDEVRTHTHVKISFDDGNASDVDIALPALAQRELHGSFFPIAARIGQRGSVDGAGLRSLTASGMSIGSHGMQHRPWRGLSDVDLAEELIEARRVIEAESGARVSTAACPLGSYDRRSLKRLRDLGYQRVFTSDRASANPHAWLQPRYSVRKYDTLADVRAIITTRPDPVSRVTSRAKITAKRWR
jgi:peptidoglycan/xylan/chitin deacetylase (PgdA/CDA1 family)